MSASLGRGGIAEWWGAVAVVCVASACCFRFVFMSSVAFVCDVSVSCFGVGSVCCFRLRWFCLLLSFASVPSLAFVCVGSVCCFSLCWFRRLLSFALLPSLALVRVGFVRCRGTKTRAKIRTSYDVGCFYNVFVARGVRHTVGRQAWKGLGQGMRPQSAHRFTKKSSFLQVAPSRTKCEGVFLQLAAAAGSLRAVGTIPRARGKETELPDSLRFASSPPHAGP